MSIDSSFVQPAIWKERGNRLLPFMRHPAAGKTASRNMTREDAREAMKAILSGECSPVTFGAFLVALRLKGESVDEIAGFLDAAMEHVVRGDRRGAEIPCLLDCAPSYDGKVRTLNVGVAAALIAAAAGASLVLQGADDVPTKCGMTTASVLRCLGVGVRRTPDQALSDLLACRIAYLHQPEFLPPMHAQMAWRREIGKRTVLNVIETLTNPLGAPAHLGGFFHDTYGDLACEATARSEVGFHRVVMVKGIEGSDELRPGVMHLVERRNQATILVRTDSDALGLPFHISQLGARALPPDELAELSATAITELLQGEGPDGFENVVLLNAAVRVYASGLAGSLEEGLERSRSALESGAARETLQSWRRCSPAEGEDHN